jgi:hypothetical protein
MRLPFGCSDIRQRRTSAASFSFVFDELGGPRGNAESGANRNEIEFGVFLRDLKLHKSGAFTGHRDWPFVVIGGRARGSQDLASFVM